MLRILFRECLQASNMSYDDCSTQVERIIEHFRQVWLNMDSERRMRIVNSIITKRSEIQNEACFFP